MNINNFFNNKKVLNSGNPLLYSFNATRKPKHRSKFCHAPDNSLYFGFNGTVMSCCYNRQFILGSWPDNSIFEIWTGEKMKELRSAINEFDLLKGCQICKAVLESKSYEGVKARLYDHYPVNDNGLPSVMEFELSNTCNLECIMCTGLFSSKIRTNREGKPVDKIIYNNEFVKQLEEFIPWLYEVKFYGGEPFLIDIYYDIWEKIFELNQKVTIMVQTNGTVLNDKIKKLLERGNFSINMSIDSLQKENFELIRKNARFETVMSNLDYFHKYCGRKGTHFGITPTPIRENWHELPDFVKFCNKLKAPIYFNIVDYPAEYAIYSWPSQKIKEVYEILSMVELPNITGIEKKNRRYYFSWINQIATYANSAEMNERTVKMTYTESKSDIFLKKRLEDYVENKIGGTSLSRNEFNKYCEKIDRVMKLLPDGYSDAEIISRISHAPINNLIEVLKTSDEEQLVQIIRDLILY